MNVVPTSTVIRDFIIISDFIHQFDQSPAPFVLCYSCFLARNHKLLFNI
ncbi:protein of unknown function [Candidatus Nitrotoga arctica]|uniref:Uncharacterized protein n=1 Tax=Candidatus Nitrotoga arctica TaxID=453162 RepID=A0ABN8AQ62_9PROT|nr:protein of unknown function [Candidatus Nitrotoga arctica]